MNNVNTQNPLFKMEERPQIQTGSRIITEYTYTRPKLTVSLTAPHPCLPWLFNYYSENEIKQGIGKVSNEKLFGIKLQTLTRGIPYLYCSKFLH